MHSLRKKPSAARLVWHANVHRNPERTINTRRAGLPAHGPAGEATRKAGQS